MHDIIVSRVYTKPELVDDVVFFRPDYKWMLDFKGVVLDSSFLKLFCAKFNQTVLEKFPGPIQIAGMEAGALPLLTALSLTFPDKISNAFYFRKSRKKHDLVKQLEGEYLPQLPLVLIDDILNTGSTFLKQCKIIESLDGKVEAVFSIVRFRDESFYREVFQSSVNLITIFELNDFSEALGLHNFNNADTLKENIFNQYKATWKVVIGKANHFDVLPKSAPVADNTNFYLGNDEGSLLAINKSTGDLVWEYKTSLNKSRKGIYSSPILMNDFIYFGAYDGNVYCLSKTTGKRLWVSLEGDYVGSSPCAAVDLCLIYVGLEFGLFKKQGGVVAIDANSGKTIWIDRGIDAFVHASPVYSKKYNLVVIGSNNGFVYAYNAKSGLRIWEYKTAGEIKYRAAIKESTGEVVIGSFDGGLYVLDAKTGNLIHRFEAESGFYSTPVIEGDIAVIGSLDKNVYAYNLKNKKLVWRFETNGRIFSTPVIKDSRVFIGSNDGAEYIIDLETGKKEAQIQLTERIVNAVLIDDESLLIPTHAGEVYRFDRIK